MTPKLRTLFAVATASALLLTSACGSSDDGTPQNTATGKVELTFWSWVPGIDKVVAQWNAANPDIHVTVSKQAQGDEEVTKVLTANKAGNPPDLFQAEYQALPTLVSNGAAADLSKYSADAKGKFAPGVWSTITLGTDAVYAIPQDSGPMMLYYRADVFEQLSLKVPTTWDEFGEVAKQVRQKDPKRYLTTFSAGDPGWFAGLAQQAGAKWFGVSGETWSVQVNDAATKKLAEYWGGLVASGAIDNKPMYTPEWNKALNDGTLIAWPSAVWGPGVLSGNAPDTAGKWKIAEMPQWTAGEHKTGSWGGSSTAVAAKSKNIAQATKFAIWLNTDPTAVAGLIKEGGIYPAATAAQSGGELSKAPAFFSNQPDFYKLAQQIANSAAGVTWGPNVNVTYATYKDTFAKAITAKTPFPAAVDQMQKATVDDLKKNGFKVSE
ncbi:extracellular solute-binding protein [Dactylosporangium sp. NPDC049742]|uniref:ABC transporter substrate-binding protein n=1 Tax=Dactylosporangium sp. NPDC049742 TaxID=3154737 RepID=UPI00342C1B70